MPEHDRDNTFCCDNASIGASQKDQDSLSERSILSSVPLQAQADDNQRKDTIY